VPVLDETESFAVALRQALGSSLDQSNSHAFDAREAARPSGRNRGWRGGNGRAGADDRGAGQCVKGVTLAQQSVSVV
jgi:hypothetical protein